MPGSDESCKILRPASHTTALGALFIAEERGGAQGELYQRHGFTNLVRPEHRVSSKVAGEGARNTPRAIRGRLREFEGYEFCWLGAGIGKSVRVAGGKPLAVAGLEVRTLRHGHIRLGGIAGAEIEIADGYD